MEGVEGNWKEEKGKKGEEKWNGEPQLGNPDFVYNSPW